ncbi:MAG: phage head closure protein [bacterium]
MIGKLRHKVGLLSAQDSPDSGGGYARQWVETTQLWAQIEGLPSKQQRNGAREYHVLRKRLTVRYRSDLTHDNRIRIKTKEYLIRSLREIERKERFLILDLEENR